MDFPQDRNKEIKSLEGHNQLCKGVGESSCKLKGLRIAVHTNGLEFHSFLSFSESHPMKYLHMTLCKYLHITYYYNKF